MNNVKIPNGVRVILNELNNNGFEAYIVGGAVRDYFLKKLPKDWDIATNAKPSDIKSIFKNTHSIGEKFGMIQVLIDKEEFEVTTYRKDGNYKDSRHPEEVEFVGDIVKDLSRRDFTINAMAYDPIENKIVDPFNGQKDLKLKIVKTVGEANNRFKEDALRMMRAVRFACKLNFSIESETFLSIINNSNTIKNISFERIRDELIKIINSDTPSFGIRILKDSELLHEIIPEFDETVGCGQTKKYKFDVFEHTMQVIDQAKKISEDIRDKNNINAFMFAALFHDIGKPYCIKDGVVDENLFKNHHEISFQKSKKILNRLKFDNKFKKYCQYIIRNHSIPYFSYYKNNEFGTRLAINKYGKEYIHDILTHKIADRIGSGMNIDEVEILYELRKRVKFELNNNAPTEISDLKITGNEIIELTGFKPGPKIKEILNLILFKVLENPDINENRILRNIIYGISI